MSQCWSCGLYLENPEELTGHLLANSGCAYEYRADGCLWQNYYHGTAHIRLSRLRHGIEPWWVEALAVASLTIELIDRFECREEAQELVEKINDSNQLPVERYQQTRRVS